MIRRIKNIILETPDRYRRIVSGSVYNHKLDGIRFLAVTAVILCHISNHTYVYGGFIETSDFLRTTFIYNLFQGVSLLFVLSSYLLSSYLFRVDIRQILKSYYYRRFVRIFPPYAVALTICMVVLVFILKHADFSTGMKHYFASLFFANNIFYPLSHPFIMPVGWTVEIEIQYYALLPFVILFYKRFLRLSRILSIIFLFFLPVFLDDFRWYEHTYTIFQVPYFLAGILLADLISNQRDLLSKIKLKKVFAYIIGLSSIFFILAINWYYFEYYQVKIDLAPLFIFLLMFVILTQNFMPKMMENRWVCFIGNMGYSLYLTHVLVISFAGKFLIHLRVSDFFLPNYIIQSLLLFPLIMGFGFVFYKYIEFPLMKRGK